MNRKIKTIRFCVVAIILFWVVSNLIAGRKIFFYEIIAQSIFITLIIIWICGIPRLYELMDVKEDYFDTDDFAQKVNNYNERKYMLITRNGKRIINIYKLYYMIFWAGLIIAAIFFLNNLVSWWSIGLMVFYAILSSFSSYRCIVFIYFLHDLQSIKTDKLKNNKYIPAWSYGYQRLKSAVEFLSPIYFMLAFLFACGYFVCVIPAISLVRISAQSAVWIFLIEVVAGWGSCIIISCLSKYYLYNIVTEWRHESLKSFQDELFSAYDNNDEVKIQQSLERIKGLSSETTGKFPLAEFSLGVLTIFINTVGMMIANL